MTAKAAKAAKATDVNRAPLPTAADGDVLHFLTRTLHAHCLDAEPQYVLAKLQNLQKALDQQESTLLDWPDSPSRDRMCEALAKANASSRRLSTSSEWRRTMLPSAARKAM